MKPPKTVKVTPRSKIPVQPKLQQFIKGAGVGNAASTRIGVVTNRGILPHNSAS